MPRRADSEMSFASYMTDPSPRSKPELPNWVSSRRGAQTTPELPKRGEPFKPSRAVYATRPMSLVGFIDGDVESRAVASLSFSVNQLFTDVLYAAYLLDAGISTSVRLRTKESQWFVSDAIPSDIESLFKHLDSPDCFPSRESLDQLTPRLCQFFQSGAITTTSDPFWTTPFSFHEMPSRAPALLKELQNSYLVIFKGDLNYRKLTRDGLWPHTTTYEEALGPLGKQSGIKILALRTNKSDVCVGVPTQREVDALNEEAPDGAWIQNGKYDVLSFNEGQ